MANGTLKVRLDVGSVYLSDHLPVEIRDGRLALVQRSAGARTHDLPAGLYRVSAMLDDGRMHEQLARVRAGESTEVFFGRVGGYEPAPTAGADLGFESAPLLQLEHVEGATVHEHQGDYYVFASDRDPRAVPFARFALPDRTVEVSLPVNPLGDPPLSCCSVRYEEPRLVVALASERTVASTVFGLIRAKEVLRGMDIVNQTTTLLRDKYRDPIGAALGGLLLQRLGHLDERADWVDNLARDFPWLPDGRILKGALDRLDEREETAGAALDLVLAAAGERPLFTDAFSLLLQLLRRWPGDARADERRQALEGIAQAATAVDWDQVVLTRTVTTRGG